MANCQTCGKCPCYEHTRKTIVPDPKSRNRMPRKPKFHIGQVVYAKKNGRYGRVQRIDPFITFVGWQYLISEGTSSADWWDQKDLRPLNQKERGQ